MVDPDKIRQHFPGFFALVNKRIADDRRQNPLAPENNNRTEYCRDDRSSARKLQTFDDRHAVKLPVSHADALQGCQFAAAVCNAGRDNVQQIDERRQCKQRIQHQHAGAEGCHDVLDSPFQIVEIDFKADSVGMLLEPVSRFFMVNSVIIVVSVEVE